MSELKKSLYGLVVAPILWYQLLWAALNKLEMTASKHDPCLVLRKDLIVICYVDDLGIQAPKKEVVNEPVVSSSLSSLFLGSFLLSLKKPILLTANCTVLVAWVVLPFFIHIFSFVYSPTLRRKKNAIVDRLLTAYSLLTFVLYLAY